MQRFARRILPLLFVLLAVPALARPSEEKRLVVHLESCEAIIREVMSDPATAIPADYLARARGIVITNQFQAGFLVGAKGGYGIVLIRRPDGEWSVPGFLNAGEASLGLQFGAKSVETVFLLMDDQAVRLVFSSRFNIGADVKAQAGPRGAGREAATEMIDASVLVYSNVRGVYAGATIKTGFLSPNNEANQRFYRTTYTLPEILFGNYVTPRPEAQPLSDFIRTIAP